MQEEEFFSYVEELWETVEPDEKSSTLSSTKITNIISRGNAMSINKHWGSAARSGFVSVLNQSARVRIFSFMKGLVYKRALDLRSKEWMLIFYVQFYEEFPFGGGDPDNFFISLRFPTERDFGNFEYFSSTGYNVLGEADVERLRSARDAATWQRLARGLYRNYFLEAASVFLIVHKRKPNAPRYRLERPISISPDQRVFLVRNVDTNELMVAKWDDDINNALVNWRLVRRAGVKMLDFKTRHALTPTQNVLITERLYPLNYTENILQVFRDVLLQLSQLHSASRIIVHSDIKPDNILRRERNGAVEYLIIDWDSISRTQTEVPNAVLREIYSPFWTSQSFSTNLPTSYRYDLQELWYACIDLEKMKLEREWEENNPGQPVPDYLASVDTLSRRPLTILQVQQLAHIDEFQFSYEINNIWTDIMSLPERLPPSEIDYSSIIEKIETLMEKQSEGTLESEIPVEKQKCANCYAPMAKPMSITDHDSKRRAVCGISCAALLNDSYMSEAMEIHRLSKAVRAPRYTQCRKCFGKAELMCVCGATYCSEECQKEHWNEHQDVCVDPEDCRPG